MKSLNNLTIKQTHEGLVQRKFSCLELIKSYLHHIKKCDPKVNGYLTVTETEALTQAREVDKKIGRGEEIGELAGIPYAAKDLFCTRGIKTTAASKILKNYIPPFESTTTARLQEQDAILVGKTNLDEFAMGSSTENSAFGPTRNPWDLSRVPGGSSGGSAAAVAADECLFALGTDTGGSIRQPASFCGVVGFKPTYGRTSRYGVIAMASSLDAIGHFTKTVEDSAIVLKHIAGQDSRDATTSQVPVPDYPRELEKPVKGLKIGVPKEYFGDGLNPEVKEIVGKAILKFKEFGAKVLEISLPLTPYAIACYYIIQPAEVSSNLARYDGIKYGFSEIKKSKNQKIKNLIEVYFKSRARGFGDEAKRRIMLGTYTLSAGYYDAYYLKAQRVRTLIKQDFETAFRQVDIIAMPTSPTTAFKIGEKSANPLEMYLADIYTVSLNLYGGPGISIPCGFVAGLPVGLQLSGKHFGETEILRAAWQYEQATEWRKRSPAP